jgi:hypothetical protein
MRFWLSPVLEQLSEVKQGAPPQGPLAPVACAAVFRFSASVPAISTMRMDRSSS